jgi:hypothetical protein
VDIAFDCRAVTLDVIVELFYETYGVGIAREWNGDNDTSDAKSPLRRRSLSFAAR